MREAAGLPVVKPVGAEAVPDPTGSASADEGAIIRPGTVNPASRVTRL